MKNKLARTVTKAMQNIIENQMNGLQIERVQCDAGAEFTNQQFRALMQSKNIELQFVASETKAAYVERFNRSLQYPMYKIMTERGTNRWITFIWDLLDSLRSRGHRALEGMSPSEATRRRNQGFVLACHEKRYAKIAAKRKGPKLTIGTRVRLKTLGKLQHR